MNVWVADLWLLVIANYLSLLVLASIASKVNHDQLLSVLDKLP